MPKRWLSKRSQNRPGEEIGKEDGYSGPIPDDGLALSNARATVASTTQIRTRQVERSLSRRSFSRTRTDMDRPRTAGGALQSNSLTNARPDVQTTSSYKYDTRGRQPHAFALRSGVSKDDSNIGMALGSPSQRPAFQTDVTKPKAPTKRRKEDRILGRTGEEENLTRRKLSGWKKFSNLFSAKNSTSTQPQPNDYPFHHQQRAELQAEADESKPLPLPKDTPKASPQCQRSATAPVGQLPRYGGNGSAANSLRVGLPKLDISIPDTQLDRYSIMFGDFMSNDKKKTSLLARRSRVLENLKTPPSERVETTGEAEQKQPGQDTHLKPQPSPRRATSPTPAKSPLFSLFPPPSTTPKKTAAKPAQSKRTSLQRSYTAPSLLSELRDSLQEQKFTATKSYHNKRCDSSLSLVETSASTTQGPGWSTDGSHLSPTSSVSSLGEEDILFDVKKLSMVTENLEPQYEVTEPDGATVELYRTLSQKMRAAKPPPVRTSSRVPAIDATKSPPGNKREKMIRVSQDPIGSLPSEPIAVKIAAAKAKIYRDIKIEETPHVTPAPQNLPKDQPSSHTKDIASGTLHPEPQPAESSLGLAVPAKVSEEAAQEVIAIAVEETLNYMGTQSEARAATPIPESDEEKRSSTPVESPVKLLVIPKNIPISRYAVRSPSPDPNRSKTHPEPRPFSPSPRPFSPAPQRAATDPTDKNQSFAARITRLQAATASADILLAQARSSPMKKHMQTRGKSREPTTKPDLTVTAPTAPAAIEPGPSETSPGAEISVARSVSLTRKQSKRLLVPPSRRLEIIRTEEIQKMALNSSALTPVVVDANRAHRPGRSFNLVIENA